MVYVMRYQICVFTISLRTYISECSKNTLTLTKVGYVNVFFSYNVKKYENICIVKQQKSMILLFFGGQK